MDQQTFQQILGELESLDIRKGLSMTDMLGMSDNLNQMLTWLVRKNRFEQGELETQMDLTHSQSNQLMRALMVHGIVELVDDEGSNFHTSIRLGRNYRVPKDVWKVFDDL
jgi:hypothetical protein